MRNFSMKKFGTPMRAGPGVDERDGRVVERRRSVAVAGRVGLVDLRLGLLGLLLELTAERLGVRAPACSGRSATAAACRPWACPRPWLAGPCPRARARASRPGPGRCRTAVGRGRRGGLGPAWRSRSGSGVCVATAPWSTIDRTGAGRPGISIESTVAPGGMSTLSVIVCPSTSVTVTRCSSAEAGTTTKPNMAAAASVMTNFRRLIGLRESPLPHCRRAAWPHGAASPFSRRRRRTVSVDYPCCNSRNG